MSALNNPVSGLDSTDLTDYAENAASHSGLDFAYKSGRVRSGTTVSTTAAGSVTLADDDTSYIEVDPTDGTVSANVTGYTSGQIPLFTVTTASGEIEEVQDDRCFFNVGGGGSGSSDFFALDDYPVAGLTVMVMIAYVSTFAV